MNEKLLEWDPSIAALIARHQQRLTDLATLLEDGGCDRDDGPCSEQCDAFTEWCLPCMTGWLLQEVESAASALTSHVWDRNAPTVPYLGQMLPQDMDVARTFNESSDPRAMLAFIKLLAVGRAQPPAALRGVRVTTDQDLEGLPGTTGQGHSLEPAPRRENKLLDELEKLRVAMSRHSDPTYSLGALYAVDEITGIIRRESAK